MIDHVHTIKHKSLTFVDFLEALARLAAFRYSGPEHDEPLQLRIEAFLIRYIYPKLPKAGKSKKKKPLSRSSTKHTIDGDSSSANDSATDDDYDEEDYDDETDMEDQTDGIRSDDETVSFDNSSPPRSPSHSTGTGTGTSTGTGASGCGEGGTANSATLESKRQVHGTCHGEVRGR